MISTVLCWGIDYSVSYKIINIFFRIINSLSNILYIFELFEKEHEDQLGLIVSSRLLKLNSHSMLIWIRD